MDERAIFWFGIAASIAAHACGLTTLVLDLRYNVPLLLLVLLCVDLDHSCMHYSILIGTNNYIVLRWFEGGI
jgi:hypothetical protein